ncbi:MAG: hypothetical protein ACOH2Q_25280, partial [Rhodococcus sp. (in: high G+C Gram-positive bacteria)]
MSASDDRRAELIAAAVADDLDDTETAELRELATSDTTIDTEIAELRTVTADLGTMTANLNRRGPTEPWLESSTTPDLRERILGATGNSEWPPSPKPLPQQQTGKQRFGSQRFGRQRFG